MNTENEEQYSARRFFEIAEKKIHLWLCLYNNKIHHRQYGSGVVTQVVIKQPPIIFVKFQTKSNGIQRRNFAVEDFENGLIDQILLPVSTIQKIEQEAEASILTTQPASPQPPPTTKIKSPTTQPPAKAQPVRCPYCGNYYPAPELNPHIHKAHPDVSKRLEAKARALKPTRTGTRTARPSPPPAQGKKEEKVETQMRGEPGTRNGVNLNASGLGGKPFYQCPYCNSVVQRKNFASHIRRVHPDQPIPDQSRLAEKRIQATPPPPVTERTSYDGSKCPYCHCALKPGKIEKHIRKMHPGQPIPARCLIGTNKVVKTIPSEPVNEKNYEIRRASGGTKMPTSMRTLSVGRKRGAILRRKSY